VYYKSGECAGNTVYSLLPPLSQRCSVIASMPRQPVHPSIHHRRRNASSPSIHPSTCSPSCQLDTHTHTPYTLTTPRYRLVTGHHPHTPRLVLHRQPPCSCDAPSNNQSSNQATQSKASTPPAPLLQQRRAAQHSTLQYTASYRASLIVQHMATHR
jgi:hypothetical protein